MPANFYPTAPEYFRVLPEMLLVVVATLIMVLEPLTSRCPQLGQIKNGMVGTG